MTIKEVCSRTGLAPDLVRAWERRYGAVNPQRRANNHREYSEDDVRRLLLLRDAVRAGHAISRIARLTEDALNVLSAPAAGERELLGELIADVRRYDGEALERKLLAVSKRCSAAEFCDDVAAPLLREVGEYWLRDASLIAKEHLASSTVSRVLALLAAQSPLRPRKNIVLATIPYERHVIGTSMAAAVVSEHGYRPLVLGGGSAPVEIADVVRRTGAAGLGISVVYQHAEHTLREIVMNLTHVPVWVGGAKAGAGPWTRLNTMREFSNALNAL